jgi:hypothetical protein
VNTIIVCKKNEQRGTLPSAFSGKRSAFGENKYFKQRSNQKELQFSLH